MVVKIVLTIWLLANFFRANAQTAWELNRNENGIKVYTSGDSSSKFKSVKVETVLAGTIQKLSGILTDVANNKNWVYNTKESYLIKKISARDIIYYSETELPWPISNRDVAIRMKIYPDSAKNTLKIVAYAVPGAVSEKKGIVRIPHFTALWNVTYNGNNRISIHYLMKMDPGGNVPPSITNMFLTRGPFETFNNLAKLLRQ